MPILAQGSQLGQYVAFNTGTFDINGVEMATLQDVAISLNWSTKEIRQLGSLLMATAPKRHGFKPSAKAKVKSLNVELLSFLMGSSGADGSGFAYNVLDGQNVLARCSIKVTLNDDPSKSVEFQFSNAVISTYSTGLKLEDAAEIDFEIQAQNVTVVKNF